MHLLSTQVTSIADAYRLWNHQPEATTSNTTSEVAEAARAVVPDHLCPRYVTFSEEFPLRQAAIFPVSLTVSGGGQRYSILLHHRTGQVSALSVWSCTLRLSQLVRLAHTIKQAKYTLYLLPSALQALSEEREEFSVELLERWIEPALEITKAAASIGVPGAHLDEMQGALKTLTQEVLALFDAQLDQETVACLTPRCAATAHGYRYYATSEPMLRRNRQQAAGAYPFLRQLLPQMSTMDVRGGSKQMDYQDVANIVDAGQSLSTALLDALNLKLDGLRHLQSTAPLFKTQAELEGAARMIRSIPKEDRPHSQDEWIAAQRIMMNLPSANQSRFFRMVRNPSLLGKLQHALAEIDEIWWPQIARMVRTKGWQPTAQSLDELELRSIDEFAQSVLVAARSGRTIDFEMALVVLRSLLGDTPLKELIDFDQTWKWLQRTEEGETSHVSHWPFIIRQPITIEGYAINPLNSVELLEKEGREMGHCAASFAWTASRGECFLFSIRSAAQEQLSTLELSLETDNLMVAETIPESAPKFRIVQHLGSENRCVSAQQHAIARLFVARLNAGDLDSTADGFWRRLQRCRSVDFARQHAKIKPLTYTVDRIPKAQSMMSHLRSIHGSTVSR